MTRKPIYTTSIACTTNGPFGTYCYTVHIYNRDFVLRTVKAFDDYEIARNYAERFWSF